MIERLGQLPEHSKNNLFGFCPTSFTLKFFNFTANIAVNLSSGCAIHSQQKRFLTCRLEFGAHSMH